MAEKLCEHNGKMLVPVKIDLHTWLLLPKEKATPEAVARFKEAQRQGRELALRSGL